MSDELKVGSVIEGKGGKKYVYKGGDRKSRESYTEFKPPVESKSDFRHAIDFGKELLEGVQKLTPSYYAEKGVEEVGKLVEEGAYQAGGKVTDVTGSPGLGYATNVATQALPSILSGSAMQKAASSILKPFGSRLMQSAVKPDKASVLSGNASKAVETMLNEGVNVTPGGIGKLGKEVQALSREVDDIIEAASKSGAHVSKASVLKPWAEKLKEASEQINNKSDVSATKKVLQEFLEDERVRDAMSIPIKTAQKMKTATYKSLTSKAYGEQATADIEAQKSIIRGLKEGIERSAPDVVPRNKRMSELLNAIEVVEPRALTAGNANIGGLASLAENPLAAGAFMLDRSALMKSILGRFLYSGAPSILRDSTRAGTAGLMATTANE